jgi:hypothetical protein
VLLTDLLLESSQAEAEGAEGLEAPPTATGDGGVPLKEHASWNQGRAAMEVGVAPPALPFPLTLTRTLTRTLTPTLTHTFPLPVPLPLVPPPPPPPPPSPSASP